MTELEQEFEQAMRDIYNRCIAEIGDYAPIGLVSIINDCGAVKAAKIVIRKEPPPEGYDRLRQKGRLDITVEALVAENPKFHVLFGDDAEEIVEKATKRLRDYGYTPKVSA